MPRIEDLFGEIKEEVLAAARRRAAERLRTAGEDLDDLLEALKGDLEVWAREAAEGDLGRTAFESRVRKRVNVVRMPSLAGDGDTPAMVIAHRDLVARIVVDKVMGLL